MVKENSFKIITRQIYLYLRGLFLCFFIYPFLSKREKIINLENIKKILVIRIDRIGDLVVSLPILKALRCVFPSATISILVRQGNESLLNNFPDVDEVIVYEGFIKTIRRLRKNSFDLAVDPLMDYPIKTALLAHFSKAEFVAGFDIAAKGCFFNIKCKPNLNKQYISQSILDLVRVIAKLCSRPDISFASFYPQILILEENKKYLQSFLKEKRVGEEDFLVGIHPGGHFPSQRWPVERFSQLTDRIIQKYKAKVVVIGSKDEEDLVEEMLSLVKEKAIKAIGLPLDKLASLIFLTKLFICNNSGPLHIACAVKTPTVSTMGPTNPVFWWPMGENHIVVKKELNCSPCSKAKCKQHYCMKLISVEDMFEAVSLQIKWLSKI
jgi:lipopolysaccharide heptosyltransferase II